VTVARWVHVPPRESDRVCTARVCGLPSVCVCVCVCVCVGVLATPLPDLAAASPCSPLHMQDFLTFLSGDNSATLLKDGVTTTIPIPRGVGETFEGLVFLTDAMVVDWGGCVASLSTPRTFPLRCIPLTRTCSTCLEHTTCLCAV
jgi:hypothetical protein